MNDMTEHWLYLAVRIGCCTYIIYKVWGWKKKIRKICGLLFVPQAASGTEGNATVTDVPVPDVMGGTCYVYLDKDAGQTVAPVLSEPMETASAEEAETDGDLLPEEVEHDLPMEVLGIIREEQKVLDSLPRDAEAVTTEPVSINDLALAGDVLIGIDKDGQDAAKQLRAARTLYRIQGTDLYDIFVSQVENAETVSNLIDQYLDENGEPRKRNAAKEGKQPVKDWRSLI